MIPITIKLRPLSKSTITKAFKPNQKMSSSTRVVLILGAGPRIGTSVATKFVNSGYKVAVVSHKGTSTIIGATVLKPSR